MQKTYYGYSYTEVLYLNEPERPPRQSEWIPIETTGEEVDISDAGGYNGRTNVLQVAEDRFHSSVIDLTFFAVENGELPGLRYDLRYVNVWYSDPERTNKVAKFSLCKNDMIEWIIAHRDGFDYFVDKDYYSTKKATLLGEYIRWGVGIRQKVVKQTPTYIFMEGENIDDIRYRLYRKRTGEFFLEEAYRYSDQSFKDRYYNRLTVQEARKWVEEHIPDAYEDLFGKSRDPGKIVPLLANIRKDTREKLMRRSRQLGLTAGELLDDLIAGYEQKAE